MISLPRSDRAVRSFRSFAAPAALLLVFAVLWLTVRGANLPSFWLEQAFAVLGNRLRAWLSFLPGWLSGLLVEGVYGTASRVVAVMLPPMAIFFPLFTLLEQLESNGIMTLYVTKPGKTNQAYTLKLTFKADVTDNSYVSTDRGTPKNVKTVGGKTTYTVDETRTTREVTTLKWTLTGIVKSAVPATSEGLGG